MSLEQAAKHLAAHGRGSDTQLVHMTKGEVNSLRQLAKANGGTLTVNPHTGLAEAGFLKSLLPMIIGAGITAATGGAAAPWMVGLGIGGLETARTGSLEKGLMAGMGAYGGAGLAGGLMGAGAAGAETAANRAIAAGPEYAKLQATSSLPGAFGEAAGSSVPTFASEGARQAALTGAQNTLASPGASMMAGAEGLGTKAGWSSLSDTMAASGGPSLGRAGLAAAAPAIAGMMKPQMELPEAPKSDSVAADKMVYNVGREVDAQGNPYTPAPDVPSYESGMGSNFGRERNYFPNAGYTTPVVGQKRYAMGGPVEAMSNANEVGANTGFPQANIRQGAYATPWQTPVSQNVVQDSADTGVNAMTGEQNEFADGGAVDPTPDFQQPYTAMARGGLSAAASHLGDYSDGGRLLKGPGDGVSDSIPAVIGSKRPARLADGEFVVPARIVSELGNGSTEAGARKLYAMLDRVQAARKKSIGKGKVAKNSRADKLLPA